MATQVRAPRLTKNERREQLLDAAAELLTGRGADSLTMEGLAAHAGVSKALPYAHFENADEVILALYRREVDGLGRAIVAATSGVSSPPERIRAAVKAYFDTVTQRGVVFATLSTSPVVQRAGDEGRTGHRFVAALLADALGLSKREALAAAVMTQALLAGALEAFARGDGSRASIETMAVRAVLALGDKHIASTTP